MTNPNVSIMKGREATIHRIRASFDQISGTYNLETGNIELIGNKTENSIDKVVEVVNHEYLHAILHEEIDKEATIALDNIDNQENSLYREFS